MNKILIVDDTSLNITILVDLLRDDYELFIAKNGFEALKIINETKIDLILLDVMMPDMDGFTVCEKIKENINNKDTPVIFITALSRKEDIVKGFNAGGVDYVTKPFNSNELKLRVKTHLELKKSREKLEELNIELENKNQRLTILTEELKKAAKTDSLTTLFNRRGILEKLKDETIRYQRTKKDFSLIIADIDFFKKVNDNYGHDCGDKVLKEISVLFKNSIRDMDIVSRWGGEEFLFLLPETDKEGAVHLANKLRNLIEELIVNYNEKKIKITMTFGVAMYEEDDETIENTIKKADEALYVGKKSGKNCVIDY